MHLRRIEVRDFKKLRHALVEDLSDGLNVLVGDNEAGKSTLLAALRAVLFERHRVGGLVAESMQPHGAAVRPEVSVDFDLKGGRWRLRKAFCQRPEAELIDPAGHRTTGDAVEERLVELLGFTPPSGRGERRPEEHHGIYGLLWVEQASAHQRMSAGASRATLASALESEVGQVLGGERGRALLAEAEARRNLHWDKREPPKPKGDYRRLQDDVSALEARRDDGAARLRLHDEKVALLAAKVEGLARHARDDRLAAAVTSLERARAAHARAERLDATVRELAVARGRADADRGVAAERRAARVAALAKVEDGGRVTSARAREAAEAGTDLDRAEDACRRAMVRAAECRRVREAADHAAEAIERALARATARAALGKALARSAEVETVADRRRRVLADAAALLVTRKDVTDLDRLLAERDAARIKRDAAGVQIGFEPAAAGGTVTVDGVAHPAGEPLRLARDAVLDLPGFGRLQVRPGGGVEGLARAVDEADARLGARLRAVGFPSRDAAAEALARKADLDAEAAGLRRVLDALAPDGSDALRLDVETLKRAAGEDQPPGAEPVEADRAAAAHARRNAQRAEADAEADGKRVDREREAAATVAAVARDRAAAVARAAEDDARALAAARAQAGDDALVARAAEADRALALAAEAEGVARAALDAVDPDATALELRRATAAEAAIRTDIDALTRDKRDLEIELRALGAEGLGERIAEADGRLALLRRQVETRDLEARASLLLHRTLSAAQGETKDRWLGPVRERVRPYLKLVQPDGEIELNETTFAIDHLVRGGVREPFDSLSVGAREQVAVITRLALADILRTAGQPSAVILDDALVNTDETRLGRMHLVLQKAAQGLQVLVLTCRESDFVTLGAPIRRL